VFLVEKKLFFEFRTFQQNLLLQLFMIIKKQFLMRISINTSSKALENVSFAKIYIFF